MIKKSNCLFFAWKKWRENKGSYLLIRNSRLGWWWHFQWASKEEIAKIRMEHFVPYEYGEDEWFPPPIFEGWVKYHDKDEN